MGLSGSGAPNLVMNTEERAVSSDINRLQGRAAQWLADLCRYMFDASNLQDVNASGVETMGTGGESFLRGTVISGLTPRPDVGTVNLLISPGVVLLIDNQGPAVDDSLGALVDDPGVQLAGALTLTPGASGTRIDVLECQRATNVLETDNRDIFNNATGLFTPAAVPKVQAGQLVYRIRLGTPGAGFPGIAAGWLPLMIASVPSTATTWDTVTCWDVRPLAADRADGPWQSHRLNVPYPRSNVYTDVVTNAAQVRLYGEVEATFQGYRAGGQLKKNTAAPWLDITDADHLAPTFPGFGSNVGQLWHLYSVFPFQLPRWVKFTDAASGSRVPGPLRGIPSISVVTPNSNGQPCAALLQTPSSTGLGDSAGQSAFCLLAGTGDTIGASPPNGLYVDGKSYRPTNPSAAKSADTITGTTTLVASWNFVLGPVTSTSTPRNGFTCPANAKRVLVMFVTSLSFSGAAGPFENIYNLSVSSNHLGAGSQLLQLGNKREIVHVTGVATPQFFWTEWIPLAQPFVNYTVGGNVGSYTFTLSFGSVTSSGHTAQAFVLGWDVGP